MLPLHRDPGFTFRFADDRSIPRFHLEDVGPGRRVKVYVMDRSTGARLGVIAEAAVGQGGWVDLPQPLRVRAGDAFIAVPLPEPVIRAERAADRDGIREVNRLAFAQEDEARLVDALRAGGHVCLSLVAEEAGRIVGHILFSRLPIVTAQGTVDSLALAPMAVLPELQRLGIGSALVRRGLEMCRDRGERSVIVLGHADYYPRFGFSPELARPLESPFSGPRFMALELIPGALAGIAGRVEYPPPFGF